VPKGLKKSVHRRKPEEADKEQRRTDIHAQKGLCFKGEKNSKERGKGEAKEERKRGERVR
jgi:hypothetical protein